MTQDQIREYEYCKKHLEDLEKWEQSLPFKVQKYGCSSGSAHIEYALERIHNGMYAEVIKALHTARDVIQDKIDKL